MWTVLIALTMAGLPLPFHELVILPETFTITELKAIATSSAAKYGLTKKQTKRMLATIECESGWVATSTGPLGERGLVQIYPKAHPKITTEQMIDPYWSLDWMAHHFMAGHTNMWVCYTMLYGAKM